MSHRLLSIIIPVRNGGSPLADLLGSLSTLTLPTGWEKEVVVGYQPSRDDTLETLRASGAKIVFDNSTGPSSNRNAAAREAKGELFYFIDADACPGRLDLLERLIEAADQIQDLGACGGPILLHPMQSWNPIAIADHLACWFLWHPHRPSGPSFFQPGASILVPRTVFEKVGGFNESLYVFDDYEFEQRIQKIGYGIYFEQAAPITHWARATICSTVRHSWRWGLPVRQTYLNTLPEQRFAFQHRPRLFWINLPLIYLNRMRLMLPQCWRHSKVQTIYSFPFLALTVFAWAAAASFGRGQPPP